MQKQKKYWSLDISMSEGFCGSRRQGGISSVPMPALTGYLDFIISAR